MIYWSSIQMGEACRFAWMDRTVAEMKGYTACEYMAVATANEEKKGKKQQLVGCNCRDHEIAKRNDMELTRSTHRRGEVLLPAMRKSTASASSSSFDL
ncbi:hypothetical protein PR202_ga05862 [Eleusine coracana subsp. coracana]|uniref:Uncharacterized protein n=1 Tax=Eleusine coracana subsp. coracana TaxID=191504 RepID=A0AAV5BTC2_ELECO|nr:hypothetical protein PR202_ga05862 [Eleusine coracana subsp. coracana]